MTDVRLTSIADSSLDDRLMGIYEQLARIADSTTALDRIADALERIARGGAIGGQPIRFE